MGSDTGPDLAAQLPERLVRNCRVLPARTDFLPLLPKKITFCEVGVALGDFTAAVLKACEIDKFYAIDTFGLHKWPEMWGGLVARELAGRDHLTYYHSRFREELQSGRMQVMPDFSTSAIPRLPDQGVNVFYIDANHTYAAVKSELLALQPKLAPDGIIICNDYIMEDWSTHEKYGVVQAVNEFMISQDWEMIYLAFHPGMFCDVALQKTKTA